jgi:RNA-directed DNA polymerase
MSDKRQKNQLPLAFTEERRSEAPKSPREGTESFTAKCETESPARAEQLMEEVCERDNCQQALGRVKANKGSPGIDGMRVDELPGYLKQHWPALREQLLSGTYQPQPVRRVEIGKPDGGMRKLGIPTVLDRLIQQAVMQVLQRRWDPTFSEHSHGFRPKRSAHQAVAQAQQYIAAGNRWVVDLDLEKFFDRVNHDKLMAALARRVKGSMDPSQVASHDLEAMEARQSAVCELRQRHIGTALAAQTAGSPHGPWRLANSPALSSALPIVYFDALGIPRLFAVL